MLTTFAANGILCEWFKNAKKAKYIEFLGEVYTI